jgi:dsDNA-binding SOS-regulon protein
MGSKGLIFKSKEDALAYGKMCHEADSISEEEPWEQWVEDGMFQVDEATIYGE